MLGKIQYEEKKLQFLHELKQRNSAFVEREKIRVHNFEEITYFICSFFKEDKFLNEKEVRLFSIIDKFDSSSLKKEINSNFKVVGYQEVPINVTGK